MHLRNITLIFFITWCWAGNISASDPARILAGERKEQATAFPDLQKLIADEEDTPPTKHPLKALPAKPERRIAALLSLLDSTRKTLHPQQQAEQLQAIDRKQFALIITGLPKGVKKIAYEYYLQEVQALAWHNNNLKLLALDTTLTSLPQLPGIPTPFAMGNIVFLPNKPPQIALADQEDNAINIYSLSPDSTQKKSRLALLRSLTGIPVKDLDLWGFKSNF